jgi:type I restriction enzyme R subunit
VVFRDVAGNEYKPEDYLAVFAKFVRANEDHIEAVGILLDRPAGWSPQALSELREKLARSRYRFTPDNLQRAHEVRYGKALVDIVSMVKHAADEQQPLLTAQERVERAFAKVTAGVQFTADQQRWLDRIREHMRQNLSIDREDFDLIPIFTDIGGLPVVSRAFAAEWLDRLIRDLNSAIAA